MKQWLLTKALDIVGQAIEDSAMGAVLEKVVM